MNKRERNLKKRAEQQARQQAAREAPAECIFCPEKLGLRVQDLTGEHFWSNWISQVIPSSKPGQISYRFIRDPLTPPQQTGFERLQQPIKQKKLRVVCAECNSVWMNNLEKAVKPILSRVMLGQAIKLDKLVQATLVRWITLKIIVLQHDVIGGSRSLPSFQVGERVRFKNTLLPPANITIWIGYCGNGLWSEKAYRFSTSYGLNGPPPPPTVPKNLQSFTFGVGDLLIHVQHILEPMLQVAFGPQLVPLNLQRLWPYERDIDWPLPERLTTKEADEIALIVARLLPDGGEIEMPYG